MKIDKNAEKELIKLIKDTLKIQGYDAVSNSVYKADGDVFYCSHYVIVSRQKLVFRMGIKKLSYDNLFWEIMGMPENAKKKMSLRATGAFVAPLIEIATGVIEFEGDLTEITNRYRHIIKESENTCSSMAADVNAYVLNDMNQDYKRNVLRPLAYLDKGERGQARDIAEANNGESGFVNEGRDFFERLADNYGD